MNGDGHDIVSMLFIATLASARVLNNIGSPLLQFVFLLSFILFSTRLSPDIDLKLPFVGHRGVTHDHRGLVVITLLLAGVFLVVLPILKISISSSFVFPLILGAVLGWLVHSITDVIYDRTAGNRMETAPWIVIGIMTLIAFWWLGGASG